MLNSGRSDKTKHDKEARTIEAFLDSYDTSGDGVVDFNEFLDMLDGSQGKARKSVAKIDSTPIAADNSYLGLCSSITSATCEKEQVSPVPSRQSSKRLSKASHGKWQNQKHALLSSSQLPFLLCLMSHMFCKLKVFQFWHHDS